MGTEGLKRGGTIPSAAEQAIRLASKPPTLAVMDRRWMRIGVIMMAIEVIYPGVCGLTALFTISFCLCVSDGF